MARMRRIYRNASLTLIAASASKATEGFLQPRPAPWYARTLPFICPRGTELRDLDREGHESGRAMVGTIHLMEDFVPWLEDKALQPLDRLAGAWENLETFEVYFVSSVHSKLRTGKQCERGRSGDFRPSFWRGLDGSEGGTKGYWVCEGANDTPYVCTYPPPPRATAATE